MAVIFRVATGVTGQTIKARLRQVSAAGALGNWWDETNSQWAASPVANDTEIAMSEGPNGYYHAAKTSLGTYTGDVVVFYWHDTGSLVVQCEARYLANGHDRPIRFAEAEPAADRIWSLPAASDSATATNIVTIAAGSDVKLGMDFTRQLPGSAGIYSVDAAVCTLLPGSITIGELETTQDHHGVVLNVAGVTAGNSHKLKVTITTTDDQVLVGYGRLEVT